MLRIQEMGQPKKLKTASRNQTSQIASKERVMPKTADSQDSKLPDLLGGAQTFAPYGGIRTFAFGKNDVEKDTHHHKDYSKDRQYVKNSKLSTTTQHSGKHSECTFSTEGTIKDIPVFGALFGGVEDRSRPDPDHKSVQSAFDDLFGSTGQTSQTERKEIESGRNLDWYKMQEEKANVERITFKDDEAKTQRVKTLDYKVERFRRDSRRSAWGPWNHGSIKTNSRCVDRNCAKGFFEVQEKNVARLAQR